MLIVILYLQLSLHWRSCFRCETLLNNGLLKHLPLLIFPPCSFAVVLQLPESSTEICSRPYPQQGRSQSLGSCNSFSYGGRCRLQKRKGARLCDDFVWITSTLGYSLIFHCFLSGIKPQRTLCRSGWGKQSFSQVSIKGVTGLTRYCFPFWAFCGEGTPCKTGIKPWCCFLPALWQSLLQLFPWPCKL